MLCKTEKGQRWISDESAVSSLQCLAFVVWEIMGGRRALRHMLSDTFIVQENVTSALE